MPRIARFAALCCASAWVAGPLRAGPAVRLGNHPVSVLTPYSSLHSCVAHRGKLYFGYGDWNSYPVNIIVSYDPARRVLALEHSAGTDGVEMMRVIGDELWVPHCDPVHHEDFHDYSVLGADGRWRQHSPLEMLHVYDFASVGGEILMASNGLFRSSDGGRSWTTAWNSGGSRLYWAAELDGAVHTQFGSYRNGTFTAAVRPTYWNQALKVRDEVAGRDVLLALGNKAPGIALDTASQRLDTFDGTTVRTVQASARGLTIANGEACVLVGNTVQRVTNPAAASPVFVPVPISGWPTDGTCLGYLDGRFYVGTSTGVIWAGNADGSNLTLTQPAIENRMPDAFGRALALDGDAVLAGAPDAGLSPPLAGAASLWSFSGGAWRHSTGFWPPAPDLGGWFGKDVARRGDLACIIEAGRDLTNEDRGADARVHLHQLRGGGWVLRHSFRVPFAQSAALGDDMLVVGTSNPAANQQAGRPGVVPYLLVRDANGLVTASAQSQVQPLNLSYGYKALARVALHGPWLIAGYSSDPSRGSTGLVCVHRRSGNTFTASPAQELPVTARRRFGFSLSAHDGWLAVGAPFDDAAAANAGAVVLYQIASEPWATAPLTLRETLTGPAQPHAEFGYAVALHGRLLLVGCPGREVAGVVRRGAVHRFWRDDGGRWRPVGELLPPTGSTAEFGHEVALNENWQAAGSGATQAAATSLASLPSLLRLAPRTGFESWLDAALIPVRRAPDEDHDQDSVPNLIEYAVNLSPVAASLAAAQAAGEPRGLPRLLEMADGRRLQFVQRKDDARLQVRLEASDDLRVWQPYEPPAGDLTAVSSGASHDLMELALPPGAPRYWRQRASYRME